MNPKPILGLPDLETDLGSLLSNMGIAFLVFYSVTHKIGIFSPKIEAIRMLRCRCRCHCRCCHCCCYCCRHRMPPRQLRRHCL
jgi:hypothetical protein